MKGRSRLCLWPSARLMGFGQLPLLVYCATDAQTLLSALATSSYILNTFSYEQQGNIIFQLVSRTIVCAALLTILPAGNMDLRTCFWP